MDIHLIFITISICLFRITLIEVIIVSSQSAGNDTHYYIYILKSAFTLSITNTFVVSYYSFFVMDLLV